MPPTYLLFDVHPVRKLVRMTLAFEGYDVHADDDTATVLARLHGHEPSMVIFGDYLPRMHAAAFLRHLSQDLHLYQRHRFLFLSTQADALPMGIADLVAALHLPVMPIPFLRERLLSTLKNMALQLPTT